MSIFEILWGAGLGLGLVSPEGGVGGGGWPKSREQTKNEVSGYHITRRFAPPTVARAVDCALMLLKGLMHVPKTKQERGKRRSQSALCISDDQFLTCQQAAK